MDVCNLCEGIWKKKYIFHENCKYFPSHEQNKNFILIKEKSWKISFLLYCDFGFIVFCDSKKFFFRPFFFYRKKSKFERNFYFCFLFSFDVEVDTNSILLSRCLLDRIISLLGTHGFVKCLHIYVKRIISQAEGVKHTDIRVLEYIFFVGLSSTSTKSYTG